MISGLCGCGCGQITKVVTKTNKLKGHIRGEHLRFIMGHGGHKSGKDSHLWKGGKMINSQGYLLAHSPSNPRADIRGYVRESIVVAEKTLGKPLPPGVIVHHSDEDRINNTPSNLVICQDDTYHKLIHVRLRAFKACGCVHYRKCSICKKYDDTSNLHKTKTSYRHKTCREVDRVRMSHEKEK